MENIKISHWYARCHTRIVNAASTIGIQVPGPLHSTWNKNPRGVESHAKWLSWYASDVPICRGYQYKSAQSNRVFTCVQATTKTQLTTSGDCLNTNTIDTRIAHAVVITCSQIQLRDRLMFVTIQSAPSDVGSNTQLNTFHHFGDSIQWQPQLNRSRS